jgi:hypothetical protein
VAGLLQLQAGLPPAGELSRQLRWRDRLALTQPLLATREPLLALRRQLAEVMRVRRLRPLLLPPAPAAAAAAAAARVGAAARVEDGVG